MKKLIADYGAGWRAGMIGQYFTITGEYCHKSGLWIKKPVHPRNPFNGWRQYFRRVAWETGFNIGSDRRDRART